MANDLRDPRYQAKKPAVPQKKGKGNPVVFLIIGILLMATGVGVVPGLVLLVAGIVGLLASKQSAQPSQKPQPAQRPAAPRPAEKRPVQPVRGPEVCGNPEPHRHFETKKPCDNPEIHSHYDEKRTPSGKKWPTEQEKRMLNMRHLYEAGLLTREEYDSEIRRLQKSGS